MTNAGQAFELTDHEPATADLRSRVLAGLGRTPKSLPTQFLYDERGSHLFDEICELPEYYPTRTELAIMAAHLPEMAAMLGPDVMVVEYGSGSGLKTRQLLGALERPVAYVPVEISREHLLASAAQLNREFPPLQVLPVCADFTTRFELPVSSRPARRCAVYFPGSTIGNFEPAAAVGLLEHMASHCRPGGAILIGVDLVKDRDTLVRAYDDAQGVTAAFNLNLLHRINAELHGEFEVSDFAHAAVWDGLNNRIQMRLVSTKAQRVRVGGQSFAFAQGEWIHTEYSHKYTLASFAELAGRAGLDVERVWTDPGELFSVQLLRAR